MCSIGCLYKERYGAHVDHVIHMRSSGSPQSRSPEVKILKTEARFRAKEPASREVASGLASVV
jgi:hypothetical protein